jgi:hypothetical protein
MRCLSFANGPVDEYPKAFKQLVIKVPQMALEERVYVYSKGLNYNVQATTIEQTKRLTASEDGILRNLRFYEGGPISGSGKATPMEIVAIGLRKNMLEPVEYDRRRTAGPCFVCGKEGHRIY